jgi:hypothetical protein
MATVRLYNAGERILCVLAEPPGEDFCIPPRQVIRAVIGPSSR